MDQFFLALSSLIVVIGPWKAAIVFAERTTSLSLAARRLVAVGTVAISLAIALVFLLVGDDLIEFFHIDESAFLIAAGLLILVFAIRMVILEDKHEGAGALDQAHETTVAWRLAAYPLSVPLLVTPAAIGTLVALSVQASVSDESALALVGALLAVMVLNLVVFLIEAQWEHVIPSEIWSIAGRVLGVLLAGFGTMLIIEGLQAIGVTVPK